MLSGSGSSNGLNRTAVPGSGPLHALSCPGASPAIRATAARRRWHRGHRRRRRSGRRGCGVVRLQIPGRRVHRPRHLRRRPRHLAISCRTSRRASRAILPWTWTGSWNGNESGRARSGRCDRGTLDDGIPRSGHCGNVGRARRRRRRKERYSHGFGSCQVGGDRRVSEAGEAVSKNNIRLGWYALTPLYRSVSTISRP